MFSKVYYSTYQTDYSIYRQHHSLRRLDSFTFHSKALLSRLETFELCGVARELHPVRAHSHCKSLESFPTGRKFHPTRLSYAEAFLRQFGSLGALVIT